MYMTYGMINLCTVKEQNYTALAYIIQQLLEHVKFHKKICPNVQNCHYKIKLNYFFLWRK